MTDWVTDLPNIFLPMTIPPTLLKQNWNSLLNWRAVLWSKESISYQVNIKVEPCVSNPCCVFFQKRFYCKTFFSKTILRFLYCFRATIFSFRYKILIIPCLSHIFIIHITITTLCYFFNSKQRSCTKCDLFMQCQHWRSINWKNRNLLSFHPKTELSQVLESSQRKVYFFFCIVYFSNMIYSTQ